VKGRFVVFEPPAKPGADGDHVGYGLHGAVGEFPGAGRAAGEIGVFVGGFEGAEFDRDAAEGVGGDVEGEQAPAPLGGGPGGGGSFEGAFEALGIAAMEAGFVEGVL